MQYTLVTLPLVMLLLSACGSEAPTPAPVKKTTQTVVKKAPPPPPKSTHKPKEVKDTNYETAYMYPEDNKKKKEKVTTTAVSSSAEMGKEECIAMITQEKFDKYTVMFGSEEASIKRCQMIKAMSS